MLPDPDVGLLPLSPEERAIWEQLLALRPQFEAGHPEDCPGITMTFHAHRGSCSDCRARLAEALEVDRELDAEDRRRGA